MIRKALPADVGKITDLSVSTLNIDPYPELVICREKVAQAVKECVCSAANFGWVAEEGGEITGFLGAMSVPLMFHERKQAMVLGWYSSTRMDGYRLVVQFSKWIESKPMIKQVCFSMDRNFDPRIGDLFTRAMKRVGKVESLPMYIVTR